MNAISIRTWPPTPVSPVMRPGSRSDEASAQHRLSGIGQASVEVDGDSQAFDQVAATFSDVSYEQTSAFLDSKWGTSRNSTLTIRENGRVTSCACALILRPPLLRAGLAYVKFGPLWRPSGMPADPARLRAVLAGLIHEYCVVRGLMLTVLPKPAPEHNDLEQAVLQELGFHKRPSLADPIRYIVDVSLPEEEQAASLGQKWRYNLRKGLKNGIVVEIVELADNIDVFAAMHSGMVRRKRFTERDAVSARLLALSARLPPALRPVVVFAKKGGDVLAGAVIGRTGDVPIYLYGASTNAALELHAGYVLQWWVVNWLREQGERWYDLGGGAEEPRLEQFKRGLVGKAGRLHPMVGEYATWAGPRGRLGGELIYRIRDFERTARDRLRLPRLNA